jgi:hypothetical protein
MSSPHVDGSDIYLASKFAGSGRYSSVFLVMLAYHVSRISMLGVMPLATAGADLTVSGYTASNVDLVAYSNYPGTGYNLTDA